MKYWDSEEDQGAGEVGDNHLNKQHENRGAGQFGCYYHTTLGWVGVRYDLRHEND